MRSKLIISSSVIALGAAACTPVDPGFGEAVRYDMAVQTIDPDPVYPEGSAQPGYHGEKAQKATERYRKDQVKKPASGGAGGGSAGGAGGASGTGGGSTPGS